MQADPIAEVLGNFQKQPEQLQRARYITALKSHDWSFEWSDDGRVRARGRVELIELLKMQTELDPTCALWNEHCRPGYERQGGAA